MKAVSDGVSIVLVEGGLDVFRTLCRGIGVRDRYYRDLPVPHYELPEGFYVGARDWLEIISGEEMEALQRERFVVEEKKEDEGEWRLPDGQRLR